MALSERISPVLAALKKPGSWILLALGFSAGLPFLLVGATLNFWLPQEGLSLTTITFLGWVSLVYGLKVLWAPWMDRVRLPFLYRWLGQRRSFMLLSQIFIGIGLLLMARIGASGALRHDLTGFAAAALFVAFAAASQEIAVDAWRAEMTETHGDEALNPTFYNYGFRIGLLVTDSLILIISKRLGWPLSYEIMAMAMAIGIVATLLAHKSPSEVRIHAPKSVRDLIITPFQAFGERYGAMTGLILLTLALYRLPDYLTNIAGTMYIKTGIDQDAIAVMRASIGLPTSMIGIAIGGACVLWLGLNRALIIGAIAGPFSNLCFSWMAVAGGDLRVFGLALIVDNLSNGIAETAVIALMTRLAGRDFTLTQYALMYSVMAFTGKFLKGFSGAVVDSLTPALGLLNAYFAFFAGTALMGIPALILCLILRQKGVLREA
jgi:MFS transporter, PAT family, beta-lactamase induction signal transducer AmpG